MAWKIDLWKAYDCIDWKFLISMMHLLKFPSKYIAWMQMCIESPSYSIMINGEMSDFFEGRRGIRQGDPLSPFLFTIAMECLSRMLQGLNKEDGFYYHPKCHRIKLSHILFADDLILFSSGRKSAVGAIKKVVLQFLSCSGLSINLHKSHLFTGGMNSSKVKWVEELIGTRVSPLPVRYLGLPLTSRSLSRKDCDTLIEKITTRLQCWSNRLLSRAGRRVLVSSVLQAMIFSWARVCILPKAVIHAVNASCASFLWNGCCGRRGGHLVKWEDVCKRKEEGGLGLKDLDRMNMALVTNQVWGKFLGRSSLWIDWLDKYWNKGKHWWEDEVKAKSSWVLKRLIQCKETGLRCVTIVNSAVSWRGPGGGFTVNDIYQMLSDPKEHVEWYKLVWNDFNAPRDSFHAWLTVQNKLLTRDRLCLWGISISRSCTLCESGEESRDHLFFECRFTQEVWQKVLSFLLITPSFYRWCSLIPWFKALPQSRLKTKMAAAAITRVMNGVWTARNKKIFRGESISTAMIIQETFWYLKMKIGAIQKEDCPCADWPWMRDMGIFD
ncbi:unnamed protein product [Rhodiola kirilowii]